MFRPYNVMMAYQFYNGDLMYW